MPFQPGNQLGVGHGRPRGSGKNQLFRKWCEEKGIQKLLDMAEGKGHGFREYKGRVVELGPNPSLQLDALKLALAYGLGKPADRVQMIEEETPGTSLKNAQRLMLELKSIENANNPTTVA